MQMEFAPPNVNLRKLKHFIDIRDLTLFIGGDNHVTKGRFYSLWRNGNFLVVQADPWTRPGVDYSGCHEDALRFKQEYREYTYLVEVIQSMADTIEFGRFNWAHLVRQKDSSYRLVYKTRNCIQNLDVWTKVVELDDIEMVRFVTSQQWEGVWNGMDVDLWIGWDDSWGEWVTLESQGHKIMQSLGLGHYTFEVLAHVSKNGMIIGLMTEPILGRPVILSDRAAVYEAVADLQRHGVLIRGLTHQQIHVTGEGIRFTSISSLVLYRNHDELAKEAEWCYWRELDLIFGDMANLANNTILVGSRYLPSNTIVLPRVPSPHRPLPFAPEQAMLRFVLSIYSSDTFLHNHWQSLFDQVKPRRKTAPFNSRHSQQLRYCKLPIAPVDEDGVEPPEAVEQTVSDEPLVVTQLRVSKARSHPYRQATSKKLLLGSDEGCNPQLTLVPVRRGHPTSRHSLAL
ncbi:hypothetical protein BV22DRAFT_1031608 [Leucogyrophana mollusca]|uniref:Uncharacterized protein n=1 Tax=Leucogyrophana mollusca TaxID=85980 RepID=A0ACB8BPK5_9AGAM|nr:hypothetical protein BV22DRAFT_1031608 [Leucogyrophana mollusca]